MTAAAIAFAVSAATAALLVRFKAHLPFIDHPNQRSSHDVPKPRSGGIAVAAGMAAAAIGSMKYGLAPAGAIVVGGAAAGFFALGLVDDLRSVGELPRLAGQTALAAAAVMGARVRLDFAGLPGWGGGWPDAVTAALSVFWIVGFVNVFNFMDGLDGFAPGKAALGGAMIAGLGGAHYLYWVSGAALGLLAFNFPPAKIFMGDGGSYLLGFLLAAGCAQHGPGVSFVACVMPLGSFLFDASITLVRRMAAGETWYKAHRSHFYQRATDLGFSHRAVTLSDYALTAAGGGLGLLYMRAGSSAGRAAVVAAWAGLHFAVAGAIYMAQRRRERPA